MLSLTLAELVRGTQGALVGGRLETLITGVSIDSRTCRPGDAFFAIRGAHQDGHAFVGHARLRGAAARLDSLSPLAVLGRGYAVCWNADRTAIIRDAATVAPGEQVRVRRARWNEVRVQATATRPRLLVVSETWDAWWSAEDNGRPVPTLVADHALRGVVLGPGDHEVVFRFRYPVFTAAAVLTLAGWLGLGAVLVAPRLRRRAAEKEA